MSKGTVPPKGSVIDVEEIDGLLEDLSLEEQQQLAGCFLRWHNEETYLLEGMNDGGIGARFTLHCEKCGKEGPTHYLVSGLHYGAWCYLEDKDGHYLANLRDQSYFCDECHPEERDTP